MTSGDIKYLEDVEHEHYLKQREKFNEQVVKTNECWYWTGSRTKGNHGRFVFDKVSLAHRVSKYFHDKYFDLSKIVRHKCDNPRCVNPKHLATGNLKDNGRDSYLKCGHKPWTRMDIIGKDWGHTKAKLTRKEIQLMRVLYQLGKSIPELSLIFDISETFTRSLIKNVKYIDPNYHYPGVINRVYKLPYISDNDLEWTKRELPNVESIVDLAFEFAITHYHLAYLLHEKFATNS